MLHVPVLDKEVAARFLGGRAGDPDQDTAIVLAGELGGLPLALEQVAAYVRATGLSMTDYLGVFRQRRADLLDRGVPSAHPSSVVATLALAMLRLERDAPAAAGLLRLLACMAPAPVPLGLMLARSAVPAGLNPDVVSALRRLTGDQVAVGDAVAALGRYSLVTLAGGMVLVHRLVQDVIRDQLSADVAAAWRQAAADLVEAAIPDDAEHPGSWPVYGVLLPHAQAVLGLTSAGMWQIALYLGFSGSYMAARDMFGLIAQAREDAEEHGPEHRDTFAARQQFASFTGRAGDAAGARDMFAALLSVEEGVLGAEHPDTLATRRQLAAFTGRAGDAAGARDMFAALLPIRERVLGPEHPGTLTARQGLATFTGEAGDAERARDMFGALLPIRERVLGPEHPDTLGTRRRLAAFTGEAGDAIGARDMFAALLPVEERVLGLEHPDTLATRRQLAAFTGEAGDATGARDMFAALLPVEERVLGPEHPDTLSTCRHLAYWTERGN